MKAPWGQRRRERWQMHQRLASFPTLERPEGRTAICEPRHLCDEGPRRLYLPAFSGMEHARKDEANSAERPRRVALQRLLDSAVLLEHFRRDRSARFLKRDLEIGHRHLARIEPSAKRG